MKPFVFFITLGLISLSTAYSSNFSSEECCCSCDSGEFIVSADLLILQPQERGLGLCTFDVDYSVNPDGLIISDFKGRKQHPNFKWDPGFRLGFGYDFCPFKAEILWTHFDTRAHHSNEENRIKWKLDYDTVDAIVGYAWQANDCLTFTPFGGARAAWIDQRIHSEVDIENKGSERLFGIGPLMGLDTHLNIGCGFNLYAQASLFWLFGNCRVDIRESFTSENGVTRSKIRNNEHGALFGGDAALGIEWRNSLCNKDFFIRLGLEHHHYFDYNYLGDGDLALNGAVLSCQFAF